MLKDTTLVIFDIDGTLFDSVDFNTENLNATLKHFGFDYRVSKDLVKNSLGCTAEHYYAQVLNEETYPKWEEIRSYARSQVPYMIATYGKSFGGVYDTFKVLQEKGIKVVLYSNCSRPYLEAAVKLIGIEAFLSYTECVKDNGLTKSEIIKKILNMYPDDKAIVVGDRIHDYEAAMANHISCVAAMYGYGQEEMAHVPYQIQDINELVERIVIR